MLRLGKLLLWSLLALAALASATAEATTQNLALQSRTCGLLPGDGAYSYIETRGVTCRTGKRVAHRARRRFCSAHDDCLIAPPAPIATIYKGDVRYNGWACRVVDGWELLVVRCTKDEMRFVQKAGA